MINVLGMWLILAAVTCGWGLLLLAAARRAGIRGTLTTFQTIWLGYAGLLCFLQLVSLVLPIGTIALALSLIPAIAGFALERTAVAQRWRRLCLRARIFAVTACVAFLAWLVVDYVCCDLVRWYDTGLYHLQAVKWISQYGTVPGLGNLHMRFGYNNSVHVFGAYVDAYWEGMAAHVSNGFFLALALAQWFAEIFFARTPRGRLRQLFCMFTLPFLLSRCWTLEPSSLGSDLPTAVLAHVLVLELVSLQSKAGPRRLLPLLLVTALGAALVTTKLAGLGMFGVVFILALWLLRRDASWRTRLVIFALPTLLVVGWIVRGVITSGWLLYPVFGRLPLPWSVPTRIAVDDLENIKSWARMWGKPPSEVFGHGFWHWFGPWLDVFRMSHEFILLVVSCALLAWRAAFGPIAATPQRFASWFAIAAILLGIVQWFTGAPDLRYGAYLFWLLAAALFAPMVVRAMREPSARAIVVAISLAYCVWGGGFAFRVDAVTPKLWGRLSAPQKVPVETSSKTGFDQLYPTNGDQCFDAPLPCSPAVGTAVPRTPGSLGDGFIPAVP